MGDQEPEPVTYLTHQEATEIDELLMGPLGFSIYQLMELAGLSVACAIAEVYEPREYKRVLVICGPGNNGGDGLVASRHLHHFGYKICICYPKPTHKPIYTGLVTQLETLSIPFLAIEDLSKELLNSDVIVDAIFGFSFQGNPRPPFDDLIHKISTVKKTLKEHKRQPFIVSIDVPSGWHVEEGDTSGDGLKPDMLVSLTAPKLCAKRFSGPHHFLGGRFVPKSIIKKFRLQLPSFPGTSTCVRIRNHPQFSCLDRTAEADPFVQFQKWYDDAVLAGLKEPNAMALSTANKDGKPSSRMVSLKKVDQESFIWCSNYLSRKGREISENPEAAILFYWNVLNRQVRVEGSVEKLSDEESKEYFDSRPREIQIAPAIANQSSVITGREVLLQRCMELEETYPESKIPRPKSWGGYKLIPQRFEFWQGDESSVQIRLQYIAQNVEGRKEWRERSSSNI